MTKHEKIKNWSPSLYFAYDECPRKGLYRYMKLCTLCFKGAVAWNGPCSVCEKVPVKAPALKRGIEIDDQLSTIVRGKGARVEKFHKEQAHAPAVQSAVQSVLDGTKIGFIQTMVQYWIGLDEKWSAGGRWLRGALDVLQVITKPGSVVARVTDWKTGGIDKRTNTIRPNEHYQDQLELYGIGVIRQQPKVKEAASQLVFLDAPKGVDPVVSGPTVTRKTVEKLVEKWRKKIKPMLSDDVFAPRPSDFACRFCDYSKAKGGPCKY